MLCHLVKPSPAFASTLLQTSPPPPRPPPSLPPYVPFTGTDLPGGRVHSASLDQLIILGGVLTFDNLEAFVGCRE